MHINKLIVFTYLLLSCHISIGQTAEFKYKEILKDWIEDFDEDYIDGLFGTWTITEIASVGGTMQPEKRIQNQIGKKLIISKELISFELWEPQQITKPTYEVYVQNSDDDYLKGTSYFNGYRTGRKKVFTLIAKDSDAGGWYFEIIHFQQLVYYHDGRLFFLSRE